MIDLFCGIGGASIALAGLVQHVASVDINEHAVRVARLNRIEPVCVRDIANLPDDWFLQWNADLWWASPPCQPYTTRGNRLDMVDRRSGGLTTLIERIARLRPPAVALENVPGFAQSEGRQQLVEVLSQNGYDLREFELCPTDFGIPNRRRRYYLTASRTGLYPVESRPTPNCMPLLWHTRLIDYLQCPVCDDQTESTDRNSPDKQQTDLLYLTADCVEKYAPAIHVVDADDTQAVTRCFTSAYGQSLIGAGSYLRTRHGVRRFRPREILALLGYPAHFVLPTDLSLRQQWRLVGNSLSLPMVRYICGTLTGPASFDDGME